jgi:hypothetical protein
MEKKLRYYFTGRQKGAIGSFYPINVLVSIEIDGNELTKVNIEEGVLRLYDKYEHIFVEAVDDETVAEPYRGTRLYNRIIHGEFYG